MMSKVQNLKQITQWQPNMKIQLKSWKVVNISFTLLDKNNYREEDTFDLESGSYFPENLEYIFTVEFKISIKDKSFDLFVDALFDFEIDEKITEDFKLSDFPKINAPAIAFPYLRAFISNLTLQSGTYPIILPSINFVSLVEEKK